MTKRRRSWKEAENGGKEDRRTGRKGVNGISEFPNEFSNNDQTIIPERINPREKRCNSTTVLFFVITYKHDQNQMVGLSN